MYQPGGKQPMTPVNAMVDRRQPQASGEEIAGPRFIPRRLVAKKTGVSVPTLNRMIAEGKFPGPIQVHRQSHLWLASEVDEWILNTYRKQRQTSE
jgi:predicted DNA-binding transcriptional regulator AlpA